MSRPARRAEGGDLLQRQARALGDPTRYDIFRYVAASETPVRIAVLTAHFHFNHSAIRQHLAKLADAGLLIAESAAPTTTGRPPLQYRVAPAAMGSWGAPGPYELLALLLLEVARGDATPADAGAQAGRRQARTYPSATDPVDALESEMASRGFEPRRSVQGADVELVLDRCPFVAAASADRDTVCDIHRGLADGILEGLRADVRVGKLVAYDPARAGCRLQLRAGGQQQPAGRLQLAEPVRRP